MVKLSFRFVEEFVFSFTFTFSERNSLCKQCSFFWHGNCFGPSKTQDYWGHFAPCCNWLFAAWNYCCARETATFRVQKFPSKLRTNIFTKSRVGFVLPPDVQQQFLHIENGAVLWFWSLCGGNEKLVAMVQIQMFNATLFVCSEGDKFPEGFWSAAARKTEGKVAPSRHHGSRLAVFILQCCWRDWDCNKFVTHPGEEGCLVCRSGIYLACAFTRTWSVSRSVCLSTQTESQGGKWRIGVSHGQLVVRSVSPFLHPDRCGRDSDQEWRKCHSRSVHASRCHKWSRCSGNLLGDELEWACVVDAQREEWALRRGPRDNGWSFEIFREADQQWPNLFYVQDQCVDISNFQD